MRSIIGAAAALLLLIGSAVAAEPHSISGAGEWTLLDHLPGLPQAACSARIHGADVDTMLVLTPAGRPVLLIGRPDWKLQGPVEAQVALDGGPPQVLRGQMAATVMMFGPPPPAFVAQMRGAHRMAWTIGRAHFQTEVTGAGAALDAIADCSKLDRTPP